MFDYPAFAALIRRKRSELKLSQENLTADALDDPASKGDISKFESGKKKPQKATIQKLCAALGTSTAEMEPTSADHPLQWAMTQTNIAIALKDRALRPDAGDLDAALAAVEGALEVFDPEHMSYDHRTTTELRDRILAEIARLPK